MTATTLNRSGLRPQLRADATIAGRIVAPAWPIETFIAVNPLGAYEAMPFAQAIDAAARTFGSRGTLSEAQFREQHSQGRIGDADLLRAIARLHPDALELADVDVAGRRLSPAEILLADLLHGQAQEQPRRAHLTLSEQVAPWVAAQVDSQTSKWCAALLDSGQAAWQPPGLRDGFYATWRQLASRDRSLSRAVRAKLADLPQRSEDAALDALEALGIAPRQWRAYLKAHVAAMHGWAAHVRWAAEHSRVVAMADYLALRLSYESALLQAEEFQGHWNEADVGNQNDQAKTPSTLARARKVITHLELEPVSSTDESAVANILKTVSVDQRPLIWLEAYEANYRDSLLGNLPARQRERPVLPAPEAQLVCCIDARSEGLRRHLEALGEYETLGFAGFFAVAIQYQDLVGGKPSALCPVLLEPRNEIHELALEGSESKAARHLSGKRILSAAENGFHAAKEDFAAPFALAEAAGWIAGPLAGAKTLMARQYGQLRESAARAVVPDAPTLLSVQEGFSLEERCLFAEVALRMMGLTDRFGRLVVLCGHGSQTENNPYKAALDCGACGGNGGGPNARTAAAILNGSDVREHLSSVGIVIPEDTWFIAAEHDTASDRVTLLDRHLIPADHLPAANTLAEDLAQAGTRLSAERCQQLPGAPRELSPKQAARHVRGRARDWAQVFPEWGLAGNAAFIVGPREITQGVDLGRRAFLHSYVADVDRDGSALENILTAPLVVAQWINCQYYFSTVEPEIFGSGTKTIHNVVGALGVLSGASGDLRLGLPWQSVADGNRLIHEPMRLLAVVQAPLQRIDQIIARNTVLQHLFGNGWVALAARENEQQPWLRHVNSGWQPWETGKEVPR